MQKTSLNASTTRSTPNSFAAQAAFHADFVEQMSLRPLPLAPWNLPISVTRQPRPAPRRMVQPPQPMHRHSNARPFRSLVAGVALALTVSFAAVGVMQVVGSSSAEASGAAPLVSAEANNAAATSGNAFSQATEIAPTYVVVEKGDSLWTVARRIQPKGDVRKLVDKLAQRVGSKQIEPGQYIDIRGL